MSRPGAWFCAALPPTHRNRKHPAHGLLSLISLLSAFLLTGIKRNQAAWKSIMRDRAENSYCCSTVCVHCWWCAVHQELPAPPPHTTYHWQPQGGFTTAIAGEPSVPTVTVTKEPHIQAVYSPFSRPSVFITFG